MTLWCERRLQVGAEFRPGRHDDEKRRLGAALRQRPQQIERGRIGPVQVLEGEHDRLRPGAAHLPFLTARA